MPHWLYCLSILSGGLWNREFFKAEGTQHLKRCVKMPPHFLISQAFPSGPTYLQVRGTVFQKLGMGIPLWRLGFLWRPVNPKIPLWGILCRARSWARWFSWTPSNSGYSVTSNTASKIACYLLNWRNNLLALELFFSKGFRFLEPSLPSISTRVMSQSRTTARTQLCPPVKPWLQLGKLQENRVQCLLLGVSKLSHLCIYIDIYLYTHFKENQYLDIILSSLLTQFLTMSWKNMLSALLQFVTQTA